MKAKVVLVWALSFLLLYTPTAPVAASPAAARMITKGVAQINGVAAPAVTSVFVGDRIATAKDSTTSLSFSGGDAVVIPEMTKVALGEKDGHTVVNLEEGTVSILHKAQAPLIVEAGGARVEAAANQPALYDVILHGNALRVVARGGTARVETANRAGEVRAGNAVDATLAPDSAPSMGLSSSDTWVWVALGLGATGLALGTTALVEVNNCHLSPSSNTVSC